MTKPSETPTSAPNAAPDAHDTAADAVSEPVKRGRGRPRKFPQAVPDGSAEPPKAKKRGRPPKRAEFSADARASLGKQLVGIHLAAAYATGIPELQIAEPDGDALAGAVLAVAEEYGLSLSGKTGAAIQLIATAAMIYMPRYFAMQARIRNSKAAPEEAPEAPHVTVN